MIELSNSVAQVIQPGQAVTFDTVITKCGSAECFNKQIPTSVKLTAKCGQYFAEFSGNISGTAAGVPVQLALAIAGSPLKETVMVSTPSAANAFNSVSTGTNIKNQCCDLNRVSVVNTGTVPVLLSANMNLRIWRRA